MISHLKITGNSFSDVANLALQMGDRTSIVNKTIKKQIRIYICIYIYTYGSLYMSSLTAQRVQNSRSRIWRLGFGSSPEPEEAEFNTKH